jgi:class 3 adenylate cyclase
LRASRVDGAGQVASFQHSARDKVQASTDRLSDLVSELLSAAHGIMRRHGLTYADYDPLKGWLTQVDADTERSSVLDIFVEHVIEEVARTDEQGKGGGIGPATLAEIVWTRTSVGDFAYRPDRSLATVLFTDIVDSTRHAAELGDQNWLELLARHDEIIRAQIVRFHGRFVRHTGDGVVAIFDSPSRAIQSAAAMTGCISKLGIDIRCGLHTGECELRGDDIGGIAVHTGARIAALADAGEVLVSSTVKDLVNGSGIAFQDRGAHALRGVPGTWRLFACS